MSESEAAAPGSARPFADRIRRVSTAAPFGWLAAGWRDFRAAGWASLGYGLIFVVVGLALAAALFAADMIYLFFPLASGFVLIGPALAIGLYVISRDLEHGIRPSLGRALRGWLTNAGPIFYAGLALLLLLLLWLRLAQLLFALCFEDAVGPDPHALFAATLFTPGGQTFLALSVVIGAVMAALAFAGAAVALPLLLDRPAGMVEAVATSWTAVAMNLPAMAVWAAIIVVLCVVGMAAGFVGLAVTLPLAGHATWHAYRATVRPG